MLKDKFAVVTGGGRKDQGNETVEDERGLTIGEVGF